MYNTTNLFKEVVSKCGVAGVARVQFDEPFLVKDLEYHQLDDFMKAYSYLERESFSVNLIIETYFVDIPGETYK